MSRNISFTFHPHEFERITAELYNSRYTNGVDIAKFTKLSNTIKLNQDYVITVCSNSDICDALWKGIKMELTLHEIHQMLSNLQITSRKNDSTLKKFGTLKRALDKIENSHCIITLRNG